VRRSEQYVREIKLRRERVSSFDQYPFSLPAWRCIRQSHSLSVRTAAASPRSWKRSLLPGDSTGRWH
jgi:hypothetical protein